MLNRRSAGLFLALTLAGCASLAPEYERPTQDLPGQWAVSGERTAGSIGVRWWQVYDDAALNRLVEEALVHNADLQLAVARVDEARALVRQTRADQFPAFGVGLDRDRTQSSERTAIPLPPGTPRQHDNYRAAVDVSYEVDLWGRLRDSTRAARADLLATEAARETVQITLVADTVQGYFALRSLDEQVASTQRSLTTRSEGLVLQKLRYENGVISEFEYRQLEAEVAAARAQLPVLERQRAAQENALAVLLGKSPREIYEEHQVEKVSTDDTTHKQLPLIVPAGLPSELLLRRPDLLETEQRLIAANARIGVARAAYFPSIRLTGFGGSESASLSDLFTGGAGIWQLAVSLTQPIWAGGRYKAQVEAANARQRQALVQYQRAIQNAFREVRDAIIAQEKTREQFEAEDQRVGALRETYRLARTRYENGVASQLDVLDAERNLLSAELNRSDALRAQRAAIADLFKALGGGWGENSRASPGAGSSRG